MLSNRNLGAFVLYYLFFVWSTITPCSPQISPINTLLGIKFISFTNFDGTIANGSCCDQPEKAAGSCTPHLCDTVFEPCGSRDGNDGSCDLWPSQWLPATYNNDSWIFGDYISNGIKTLPNFIVSKYPYIYKTIDFTIKALEVSEKEVNVTWDFSHQPIATFYFPIDWVDPLFLNPPIFRTFVLNDTRAQLVVGVFYQCDRYFYTEDCSVYCKPDDVQYTCNDNGTKLCLPGRAGPNCIEAVINNGVSTNRITKAPPEDLSTTGTPRFNQVSPEHTEATYTNTAQILTGHTLTTVRNTTHVLIEKVSEAETKSSLQTSPEYKSTPLTKTSQTSTEYDPVSTIFTKNTQASREQLLSIASTKTTRVSPPTFKSTTSASPAHASTTYTKWSQVSTRHASTTHTNSSQVSTKHASTTHTNSSQVSPGHASTTHTKSSQVSTRHASTTHTNSSQVSPGHASTTHTKSSQVSNGHTSNPYARRTTNVSENDASKTHKNTSQNSSQEPSTPLTRTTSVLPGHLQRSKSSDSNGDGDGIDDGAMIGISVGVSMLVVVVVLGYLVNKKRKRSKVMDVVEHTQLSAI